MLFLAVCTLAVTQLAQGNLDHVLNGRYETLHPSQLRHRVVKRDVDGENTRQIQFSSLGRNFHLYLRRGQNILASDFKVMAVDKHNKRRKIDVDTKNIYSGYILDEPGTSVVHATLEEGDTMTATIRTKDETYVVEPSWRHLPDSDNYTMIAYKRSDINMEEDFGRKYCGFVSVDDDLSPEEKEKLKASTKEQNRQKREAEPQEGYEGYEEEYDMPRVGASRSDGSFTQARNTCPVLVVADFRFYENMGQSSFSKTTSYLIGLIDRVDRIYRDTDFGHGYTNFGFEIKEMWVHQEWTKLDKNDPPHYNQEQETWQTKDLLENFSNSSSSRYCLAHLFTSRSQWANGETLLGLSYIASPNFWEPGGICTRGGMLQNDTTIVDTEKNIVFSRKPEFKRFCLAHLFTYLAFEGGVLGLAYIGSPRTYSVGGICSPEYYKGYKLYLNTGWSSSLNKYNRRLLTQEADLVTAHEFGHNWGSEHDPDTKECSPSSFAGGKYIMYTYSVSGYDDNNKYFSPCSKRAIGAVLRAKASRCFEIERKAFCGNSRQEEGEECDVGPEGQHDKDPCCDAKCQLRPTAVCSDKNHECCENCYYAPANRVCYEKQVGSETSCDDEVSCTGTSEFCPPPRKLNGTDCSVRGECQNGKCIPFCERMGMLSCICDEDPEMSCRWCCRNSSNSTCSPVKEFAQYINLPNGMPCFQGYCEEGKCKKQVQDLVERIWKIIENLTPSQFVEIMRANIVGTVIILSLVIWIPVSCVVSWKDRQARRKEEDEIDWLRQDNHFLIRAQDAKNIRSASKRLHKRKPVQVYGLSTDGTKI